MNQEIKTAEMNVVETNNVNANVNHVKSNVSPEHQNVNQMRINKVTVDFSNIRVGSQTNPKTLAGLIVNGLLNHREIILKAVGHMAVNQAQKAIAIASTPMADNGFEIMSKPYFESFKMNKTGDIKTGLGFRIIKKKI